MHKALKKDKRSGEQKTFVILSAIFLVLFIIAASFFLVFFDRGFYDKSFQKYKVYDELGIDGVQKTTDYLIKYLTSENTEINNVTELTSLFTPEELSHLNDVRHLINAVKYIGVISLVALIGSIAYLAVLKDFAQSLRRVFLYAGISCAALIVVLFILASLLSFGSSFEIFHKLLFPHGNYSFPAQYLLIKLFPEAFFRDFALKVLFHSLILSLIFIFLGSSSALAKRNPRRH